MNDSSPPSRESFRLRPLLVGIVALAAVLRMAYFVERRAELDFDRPLIDAAWHHWWAVGWATGDWTPPPGEAPLPIDETPYFRPPGYPLFVAAVYRCFGVSISAVVAIQMLLGLARVLLVFDLARRAFSERAGLFAALLIGVWWTPVYFEGELHPLALLDVLLLGSFWCMARSEEPAWREWAGAGLLAGLALLVRPDALPIAAAVGAFGIGRSRGRRVAAAASFGAALTLTILPVSLRNAHASGEWVWISSNAPVNLYLGNHGEAPGTCTDSLPSLGSYRTCWDWPAIRSAIGRHEGPVSNAEANRWLLDRTAAEIREDPGRWWALEWRKARMFWGPREIGHNKELALDRTHGVVLRFLPGTFSLLVVAAVWGAWCAWRRRQGLALSWVLSVAGSFVVILAFFVSARYRQPVVPLLAMLAGGGLADLDQRWAAGRRSSAVLVVGGLGLLLGLLCWSPAAAPASEAKWRWRHANLLLERRELVAAGEQLELSLEADPGFTRALIDQARVFLDLGDPRALEVACEAAARAPKDGWAQFAAGKAWLLAGQAGQAVAHLEKASRLRPRQPGFAHREGVARMAAGDLDGAGGCFVRVLLLDPDHFEARESLGVVHAQRGRDEEARPLLQATLEADPDRPAALYAMGLVLERSGEREQAVTCFARALAVRPDWSQAREALDRARR